MLKRSLSSFLSAALIAAAVLPVSAAQVPVSSGETKFEWNSYNYAGQMVDDDVAYSGQLGAIYSPTSTVFKVWAPKATLVKLNRYKTGDGDDLIGVVDMVQEKSGGKFTGVWTTTVSGDIVNTYYTYTIATKNVNEAKSQTNETQDVYSYAVGVNGDRSMVVDLDKTDPAGWDKDSHIFLDSPTNSFVWEVHVKDFSYASNSGVSEKNRGKFLAFTETGTTLNGEGNVATCLDYLKQLGVTTVQILPMFDYASVDETGSEDQFNWGYDPKNYNVPEGSYSSDPYNGNTRITECKQMIQALHNAGISVVMDVVYNHVADVGTSCFERTVPNYYFRMNADGTYSNGSGCGNETASERAMYRKFMIESCAYWVNEYHVDGLRFDLMALHDVETMNLIRSRLDEIDSRITIWGEGWTGGDSFFPPKTCSNTDLQPAYIWDHNGLSDRVGFFNDGLRNALKSENGGTGDWGWIQGSTGYNNKNIDYLCKGMEANKDGKLSQPTQAVSYVACHDNSTLWDQLCTSQGMTDCFYKRDEKLVRQNKLAAAMLNLSQGATFILAGEEMCRSKGGDHNSYKSPPSVNMIDWSLADENSDVVSYYRGMRQIRENFSLFTASDRYSGSYDFLRADTTVACICTNNTQGEWNKLLFIGNSSSEPADFTIPDSYNQNWVIIANEEQAGIKKLGEVNNGYFSIAPNSIVIAVDSASFKSIKVSDDMGRAKVTLVDKNSGETLKTSWINGKVGTKYSAYTPSSYTSNYALDEVENGPTGTFSSDDTEVTASYVYTNAGTVSVNYYQTGTTTPIHSSDEYYGRIGDTLTITNIPSYLGYTLNTDKLPESTVKFIDGKIDVNYYYDKTSTNVTLHIKHGGSASWNPIVWLWGSKDGSDSGVNYCTNKEWPGDTLTYKNSEGWYDKTFIAKSLDNSFNLIVSNYVGEDLRQTVDYRGLTQNQLWIVIDDEKNWSGADSLTFYTENPDKSASPAKADLDQLIEVDHIAPEPKLYDINKEPFTIAYVSSKPTDKTIEGAYVSLDIDKSKFPNDKYFTSFTVNDGAVKFTDSPQDGIATFMMPSESVTVRSVLGDCEEVVIDLTSTMSVSVPDEAVDNLKLLSCYSAANSSFDLNGDGTADAVLSGCTVTRAAGADMIYQDHTFDLTGRDVTDRYGKAVFKMLGELYTVSFGAGRGTGKMEDAKARFNRPYTLPDCLFTAPEGEAFDGWVINGTKYAPGDEITVTSDTTVVAEWAVMISVKFDANGGSGEMQTMYSPEGKFVLPVCEYTSPNGSIFDKWIIDGKEYEPGDSIDIAEDITVKASWREAVFHEGKPASCEVDGQISYYEDANGGLYDANGAPLTDRNNDGEINKDDLIDKASGHSWKQPVWKWTGTGKATAEFICENDPTHIMISDASITSRHVDAAGDQEEMYVYTAIVIENGEIYTDERSVPVGGDTDSEITDDTDTAADTDSAPNTDTDSDTDSGELAMVGDLDGDNMITSTDALIILRISVGVESRSDSFKLFHDVDGDGELNSADAVELLRYSVSLSKNKKIGTLLPRPS